MPDEIVDKAVEELKDVEHPIKESEEVKEPEIKEPVVSEEQVAAFNLFKALKDPETAGPTLRHLADLAGFDLASRKQQTELKKSITQTIVEELGEDNSILAEKLGPALEKIISKAIEDSVKPITKSIATQEQKKIADEIEATLKTLESETKGLSKKLESRMTALMDEVAPGRTTPAAYIRKIYKLASSEFEDAEKLKAQDKKRDQNRSSSIVSPGVNPERVKAGSRLPTHRESVEAAMRGEMLE